MALPTALTGQAYDIVDKAMKTGGRGQSQTITDYSAISDAFMKKASLDAQIGGMLMDNTIQRASLLSDLDMGKANLYMQSADLALRESHFNREMKAREDADKMSPFEQITGVLAGAAGGAATGFMLGGPPGAIAGGVAGGALTLGAGNSRRAQSNTIGNIGAISNAAVSFKAFSNHKKAQDAGGELMKGVGSIAGIFRNAAPGSEEFQGAQRQLDNYVNTYTQQALDAGVPMQQVYQNAAAIRKEAMGGFDPNDQQMVASRNMQQLVADAKADEVFMDPKAPGHRERVQQFQSDMGSNYIMGWGKAPTAPMVQAWTGQVDAGVAQQYFSAKPVAPAQTTNLSSMGGGGNTVSSDMGVSSSATGTKINNNAGATPGMNQPAADDGTMIPNMVMAPGQSSGASQAWGVDMDNGPEMMLGDAMRQSGEAAKDPNLARRALGQEPVPEKEEFEPEGPGMKEKIYRGVDRVLGFGSETGKPKVITGFGNEADRLQNERNLRNEAGARMAEADGGHVKIEPTITSTDPVEAQKESVFKNATSPKEIIDEFGLQGRYGDKATTDAVNAPVQAAVGMNKLRDYINTPEVQDALQSMTPEQKALWDKYVQGLGEDAMKGSSKGVAGSALGASAQANWSEFERSVELSNQGRGAHHGLTKEQLSTMNRVKAMLTPSARTIGMAFNKGTLTEQDVAWVPASIVNMFDQDLATATAGFNDIQNSVWDMFSLGYNTYQTSADKSSIEINKANQKVLQRKNVGSDDEFQIFD